MNVQGKLFRYAGNKEATATDHSYGKDKDVQSVFGPFYRLLLAAAHSCSFMGLADV